MSAETVPSEVATDLDCIRWYVECLDAVAFKRRAVAGLAEAEGSYNAAMKRLAGRSTRPAEPAAPVAEAGEVERRWIGVVPSGLGGPAKLTRLERVAEIWRDQGLSVTEWVPASTLEAERARADELRRLLTASGRCVDDLTARLDAAEQRAADALARAEKAEGLLETAREDERDRLYSEVVHPHTGLVVKDGRTVGWTGATRFWLEDKGAMLPADRAAARASREAQPATDGGEADA